MRAAVWILDPALSVSAVEPIVADLTARGLKAETRDMAGALAVVVEEPPADLKPPEGVVRHATVDLPGGLSRRAFLELFAGALAVALAGAGLTAAASFATPPAPAPDDVESVEVATLAELKARGSVRFRLGKDPCIAVLAGEEIVAVSLVCTHLGCLVDWSAERREFLCPCHRAAFDARGNVLQGPPPRPLARLAVSVDGDRVRVHRSPRA